MPTLDYVYLWGQYQQGGGQYSSPHQIGVVGTGAGGSAVSVVDADASFWGIIAGGVAYGYGDNGGNQIITAATNPITLATQIGAASQGGSVSPVWATPVQAKGGAQGWQWIDSAGNVWFVGSGGNGINGQGVVSGTYSTPVQVKGVGGTGTLNIGASPPYGSIASGSSHALALLSNGTCVAWGDNTYGESGDGGTPNTPTQYLVPHAVSTLTSISFVSCGNKHDIALSSAGVVSGWGQNQLGQLGLGTSGAGTNTSTPSAMLTPWVTAHAGSTITAVSAGGGTDGVDGQTLMIDSRHNLWGCGANAQGQLGIGNYTSPQPTPVLIMGPDATNGNPTGNVTLCTSGSNHGMAVCGGALYVWGSNQNGQLGLPGISTSVNTPQALFIASGTFNYIFAGNQTSIVDLSVTSAAGAQAVTRTTGGLMSLA